MRCRWKGGNIAIHIFIDRLPSWRGRYHRSIVKVQISVAELLLEQGSLSIGNIALSTDELRQPRLTRSTQTSTPAQASPKRSRTTCLTFWGAGREPTQRRILKPSSCAELRSFAEIYQQKSFIPFVRQGRQARAGQVLRFGGLRTGKPGDAKETTGIAVNPGLGPQ